MTQKRKHGKRRRGGRGRAGKPRPPLKVSDHAIVRYLERVNHVRIDNIRERILTPELCAQYATLGDGRYPLGDVRVVIKDRTVITVLERKNKKSPKPKLIMPNIDDENLNNDPLNEDDDDDDEESDTPELSSTTIGEAGNPEDGLFAQEEQERKKVDLLNTYRKQLSDVEDIERMTATTAWWDLQQWATSETEKQTHQLTIADKTRDIIHAQEAVRILPQIVGRVRKQVEEFTAFVDNAPDYAKLEMRKRAQWNEDNNTVSFIITTDLFAQENEAGAKAA
jgi:hypothetical protein